PGFDDGLVSIQDGAAQLAADRLDLTDGLRVLDACAAPGGKAAHILERARVDLTCLDIDTQRLQKVGRGLERLGLAAQCLAGDATQPQGWWDGQPFDRILVDAPCSATGVIRRHPDTRSAPGGKAAHILERARVDLTCLYIDTQRLQKVGRGLERLGLAAQCLAGDATQPQGWWDGQSFDRILVDAPCSAAGVIRRHPDIRWLRPP